MVGQNIDKRVYYINWGKPVDQRPLRLHLMRPAYIPEDIQGKIRRNGLGTILYDPDYSSVRTEINDLHAKQCDPLCPFALEDERYPDDPETIFHYRDLDGNWCLSGRENSRTSDWAQENTYKEPIRESIET